jgi:thiol-disulfide isomerase/thioredoxin
MLSSVQKAGILGVGALILIGLSVFVEARGREEIRRSMIEDIAALGGEAADRPAPAWSLPTEQGGQLDLASLRGKVIFLNFWASWCPPCREEMPSMEDLARKYEGRDLVMVAISQDTEVDKMRGFLRSVMPDQRWTMQIPLDPEGVTSRQYGTQLLPETYIIDREGRVVARFVNKYDWNRPEVDRFIERLLRQ